MTNYTAEQLAMWNRVVKVFKDDMIPVSFDAWIGPLELYAVIGDDVIALFKNPSSMSMMMSRYFSKVETVVRSIFGMRYNLKIVDARDVERQQELLGHTMLNPKYTFENFVVGPSNNLAYAASLAVAEQPSEVYNPLFIYGDVGLGKTHLMNAIGNYISTVNPMANVLLTSSERFTNELIEAIVKKSGAAELRNRMRNVDVLMVDDIQFLSKTTATQEEFFHTFNDLRTKGKQIIISSDRPPKELPAIEERLRSRLEWGLIVDIQKPDFETRVAILHKKAMDEGNEIDPYVLEYIAAHFDKSIRELEGAMTRVVAQANLLNQEITMDLAVSTLSSLASNPEPRRITTDTVIEAVARRYGVENEDLLSKKRNREIAAPRQVAIYLCRELTDLSTTNIGRAFGGRDHTTVMHSCDKVAEQIRSDPSFKRQIDELADAIRKG